MSATFQPVSLSDVQPGDIADHWSGMLDPRPVAEVNRESGEIRLQIGSIETDWVPMENYTFGRHQEVAR